MSYHRTPSRVVDHPFNFGYSSEDHHNIRENTTPFLNLEELRKEERSSVRTKKQIYKLILAKCHEKIKRTNSTTDNRECYYEIPIFLPGYPVYSTEEAKAFVLNELSLNGLDSSDLGVNRIYISWHPKRVNHQVYQQRAVKLRPKPNIYKVEVSPSSKTPSRKRNGKISNTESPKVSMLQYDHNLEDMIPVNTKKIPYSNLAQTQPIEVEDQRRSLVLDQEDDYRQEDYPSRRGGDPHHREDHSSRRSRDSHREERRSSTRFPGL